MQTTREMTAESHRQLKLKLSSAIRHKKLQIESFSAFDGEFLLFNGSLSHQLEMIRSETTVPALELRRQ